MLLGFLDWASAVIQYAIPEETAKGTFVGNFVADLGLDFKRLSDRRLRVVSGASKNYFEADLENGRLFVNERINREEICGSLAPCLINFEIVIENPLELYSATVEIQDINDNAPAFFTSQIKLQISESVTPGARFPLESAQDADVGANSLQTYEMSANEYFVLNIQTRGDGSKYAELVLEKELDREEQTELRLNLRALDGGIPPKSASVPIIIDILDANDNKPVFNQSTYTARVWENAPTGTLIVKVKAFDLDEGLNGDIIYSFGSHTPAKVRELFFLDSVNGELRVKGLLDFEDNKMYEVYIQANDKGPNPGHGHCKVEVEIIDVNDNTPEITVTSVYSPIPEDALPGTVVALLSVMDLDSGQNGLVNCFIPPNTPFSLSSSIKNYFTLKTKEALDRELISVYNISITATDAGSPSLSTGKTLIIQVSDVNDNAPKPLQSSYNVYVTENGVPGTPIFNVSASDPDSKQNGQLCYSIVESDPLGDLALRYFSINYENGSIYVLLPLDYENIREFKMIVQVSDGGSPVLSTNITINVFVTDQNDNAPSVLYPRPNARPAQTDLIPRTTRARSLVTKIIAWDADAGHNAWISYFLLQATDSSLFTVGLHSGEIRTARDIIETDAVRQILIILIKDNGEPVLSSTATITISVTDTPAEALADVVDTSSTSEQKATLTFYLIISLILVSVAFFIMVVVVGFVKLYKWRQSKDSLKTFRSSLYRTSASLNYVDAVRSELPPQNFCHRMYLTTESGKSDFLYKKANLSTPIGSCYNTLGICGPGLYNQILNTNNGFPDIKEQAQPNTDWRFSQAQRPGTSGSQNPEEGGAWPNNQLETERLQAMILASANAGPIEAADGSSTLGGAAGTMGLSTRYGPQFTLQHVPDYRQNVYIPGNTATLTNSAGKRDGKGATSSGGNKKKSGKKEKK
ncbi:protocadherin gamma-C3-like isoform X14 [Rhinatrema bivittatum]|uniref:protocadherin gamma-C3-like isoform X14 n=1 Tax=Rhinatrema bivittatum TaxID=194408 RepID=UPI001126603D|nr:protocadherin gamma-C3-like isoform X14 [Rhinatrema bivittatum]